MSVQSRSCCNWRCPLQILRQGIYIHKLNSMLCRTNCIQGNCKFGPKCANVHIMPDGRRINYNRGGIALSNGPLNLGARLQSDQYNHNSNLNEPIYQGQYNFDHFQAAMQNDMNRVTLGEANPSSPQIFPYDAPEGIQSKFPNVLDVQLPASFDNHDVSWIARHGPVAASVPSRFGIDPVSQSLSDVMSGVKDARTSETLKILHSSAYGDDTRDRFNGVAKSPSIGAYVKDEEHYPKRTMHSQRAIKTSTMSASLPQAGMADADWDTHFTFEEDYIPNELSHLLTAQEKARRMSRNGEDVLSTSGTPDTSSKFGSPANASPSGWSSLRQRQQRDEEINSGRISDFALVGSPLRNSSVLSGSIGIRPTPRPLSGTFDQSPWVASPPRHGSLLSGMFQKSTHLNASTVPDTGSSSNSRSAPIGTARRTDLDRATSSSNVTNHRLTTPIDEEQGDCVFSMDEEVRDTKDKENGHSINSSYVDRSTQLGDANELGTVPATSVSSNGGRNFRMLHGDS